MKTSYSLLAVLISYALSCLPLAGRTERDATYRFSIALPDSCDVEYSKETTTPYLFALAKSTCTTVNIAHTKEGSYSYRKAILGNPLFKGEDFYYLQPKEPWFNLLRHSRVCIESPIDSLITCNRFVFRAQTLFWVRVSCEERDLDAARVILDSFDAQCNLKSYFRIMKCNLRWYQGSLYLTLVPIFAFLAGNKRTKWRRSGKKDEKSVLFYLIFLLSSLALIGFGMFCLKDCIPLACIIGILSLLIAAAFFFKWEFIMNFFDGLF